MSTEAGGHVEGVVLEAGGHVEGVVLDGADEAFPGVGGVHVQINSLGEEQEGRSHLPGDRVNKLSTSFRVLAY